MVQSPCLLTLLRTFRWQFPIKEWYHMVSGVDCKTLNKLYRTNIDWYVYYFNWSGHSIRSLVAQNIGHNCHNFKNIFIKFKMNRIQYFLKGLTTPSSYIIISYKMVIFSQEVIKWDSHKHIPHLKGKKDSKILWLWSCYWVHSRSDPPNNQW